MILKTYIIKNFFSIIYFVQVIKKNELTKKKLDKNVKFFVAFIYSNALKIIVY